MYKTARGEVEEFIINFCAHPNFHFCMNMTHCYFLLIFLIFLRLVKYQCWCFYLFLSQILPAFEAATKYSTAVALQFLFFLCKIILKPNMGFLNHFLMGTVCKLFLLFSSVVCRTYKEADENYLNFWSLIKRLLSPDFTTSATSVFYNPRQVTPN